MLFQKNTLKFNSFSKGWIPSTEVFPNGNPNDSATDIVNFDVDSVKGGLVKTNGYSTDTANYSNSLSGTLSNPYPLTDHIIKYLHNYSLGIPVQADFLLLVAYLAGASQKYKWLIRDMLMNDVKVSSGGNYFQWYNLLLQFDATATDAGTSGNITTLTLTITDTAAAGEILENDETLMSNALDGFIVDFGTSGSPNYRTVLSCGEHTISVTPTISISPDTACTLYRSRLSLDADFDSIFNPSQEYSAFIVNNIMSKMMIGLGKEVKPLWMGYINKHYFYNKTNSKYLFDSVSGISCQRNIALEKRIPEFDLNFELEFVAQSGNIQIGKTIELAITAAFDGYQEVVPSTTSGTSSSKNISLSISALNNGNSVYFSEASPVSYISQSDFYMKLFEGVDEKVEIRFINKDQWVDFVSQLDVGSNPNKIWIKHEFGNDLDDTFYKRNVFISNLYHSLRQTEAMRDDGTGSGIYIGSFTFTNFTAIGYKLASVETENPEVYIGSDTAMEYSSGSEWIMVTNARFYGLFKIISYLTTLDTAPSYNDQYQFLNGILSPTISENIFEVQLPIGTDSLSLIIKPDSSLFNRRITSYSLWGRYKPDDETVGRWLKPFYQLKKIFINDSNLEDEDSSSGWEFNAGDLIYQTYIKIIYGNELDGVSDENQLSEEVLSRLSRLSDLPQLLPTLKYEPSVGVAAKYGAATIHNNTAWIADTDDNVEVLRFSRTGSTGTNNLDIFSFDFDSSIGFEMIGQDSPGHITALASRDDELIVLRDNSFFSVKTGIETISVKQGGNYVGCKYPRSLVTSRYGVIFADDNGIWLYQGSASGSMNVIQINWQWDNYYKSISDLSGMFACWNGRTEEYWLYVDGTIYVADFKNIQSIDQSMAMMKDKEKILVPWRKKKFNSMSISDFTIDSYGNLIFADAGAIYFDDLSIFSMAGSTYTELYVDSKIITQHSPLLKVYEVLTETLKDAVNDWKFDLKLYVNGNATARQTVKMWGNCNNQENLICVRPVNIGNSINDVNIRIDMGGSAGNGTTVKKLRAFGLNILTRKEKYVSE